MNKNLRRQIMIAFLYLVLTAPLNVFAQDCVVRNIPKMWVSRAISVDGRDAFQTQIFGNGESKAQVLNRVFKKEHLVVFKYESQQFDRLIKAIKGSSAPKGIRVYIAAYDPRTTDASMAGKADKELLFIFCRSTGLAGPDEGSYYVFDNSTGDPVIIQPAIKEAWINYYESEYSANSKAFLGTIENTAAENNCSKCRTGKSDTKSIYYEFPNFVDFIQTERVYQDACRQINPNGETIDSIAVCFAAQPKTGMLGTTKEYRNRFYLLFEFCRNGSFFYIDDTENFDVRVKATFPMTAANKRFLTFLPRGGDNGQLCPANCPK